MIIEKWTYKKAVEKLKPLVFKWKNLTVDIVADMYAARENLKKQGLRTDLTSLQMQQSWGGFCAEIGINRSTVHRWLEHYSHKENKLLTDEELQKRKQIETKQKQEGEKKREQKMRTFTRTGQKPQGWTRADDYHYKKFYDSEERDKRIRKAVEEKEAESIKSKESESRGAESGKTGAAAKDEFDRLQEMLKEVGKTFKKFETLKEGVSGNEDILAIIEVKLSDLPNDKRRHEFCNTIIKFLREKAIYYNRLA